MRHHQVYLQLRKLVVADRHVAERAESCCYAIDRLLCLFYLLVEIFTAAYDALACVFTKFEFITFFYYLTDTFNREMFC